MEERYLTIALGKGRLAKHAMKLFTEIGMPCTEMEDPDTRKLIFVNEEDIRGYAQGARLPVTKSNCPADGFTKREYTKELLNRIYEENPGARDRMFGAILNHDFKGWPPRIDRYEALKQL